MADCQDLYFICGLFPLALPHPKYISIHIYSPLSLNLLAKQKFALPESKSLSAFGKTMASVPVTSVTGMQMMTPLGPGSHQYKIRKIRAHQSGTVVGDHQMPYAQSEAFLDARK